MKTQQELLEYLNEQQRKPVLDYTGSSLIIAGAGSGKTACIVSRTAYMIQDGIAADSILMFTFTRKGANEIKERIVKMVGPEGDKVTVGTYHSVCGRLLRSYCEYIGYKKHFSIYDPVDSMTVLSKIISDNSKKLIMPPKMKPENVSSLISWYKENMMNPSAAIQYANDKKSSYHKYSARIYEMYQKELRDCNAMDFDDLIYNVIILFEEHPEVKAAVNDHYRYIVADEVQDSSPRDLRLIYHLAGEGRNLCMVGDDAQSIYSFRGANLGAFFDFVKEYNFKQYRLERNYRSTQTIVDAAQNLIENNEEQLEKKCFSENAKGQGIVVLKAPNEYDEAIMIAKAVNQFKKNGYKGSDIAVLYRLNKVSRKIEDAFVKSGIRYAVLSGKPFYMREAVRDCTAYLRLVLNPLDYAAFIRVINVPKRYIGDVTLERISKLINSIKDDIITLEDVEKEVLKECGLNKRQTAGFQNFICVIKELTRLYNDGNKAEELIEAFVKLTNYEEYAAIYEGGADNALANLEELKLVARECGNTVDNLVNEISMCDTQAKDENTDNEDDDKVNMLTVHGSKGLEWPVVIVAGCHNKCFPNENRGGLNMEEERRLFYVAMTRAKSNLIITYPVSHIVYGKFPEKCGASKFVDEINDEYLYKPKKNIKTA